MVKFPNGEAKAEASALMGTADLVVSRAQKDATKNDTDRGSYYLA